MRSMPSATRVKSRNEWAAPAYLRNKPGRGRVRIAAATPPSAPLAELRNSLFGGERETCARAEATMQLLRATSPITCPFDVCLGGQLQSSGTVGGEPSKLASGRNRPPRSRRLDHR